MASGKKFRKRGSSPYDGGCSKRRPVAEEEQQEVRVAPTSIFDVGTSGRNLR